MVSLAKLNGKSFVLNAEFIEALEATPDTVVTLTNGKKLVVKDSVDDVVRKTIAYKRLCNETLTVVQSATPLPKKDTPIPQ